MIHKESGFETRELSGLEGVMISASGMGARSVDSQPRTNTDFEEFAQSKRQRTRVVTLFRRLPYYASVLARLLPLQETLARNLATDKDHAYRLLPFDYESIQLEELADCCLSLCNWESGQHSAAPAA